MSYELKEMSEVVIYVGVEPPRIRGRCDDGLLYVEGDFGDYIDADQKLRPLPISHHEMDNLIAQERWLLVT